MINKVSVIQTNSIYPKQEPFHPSKKYPEYKFSDLSSEENFAYDAVRESFIKLRLDEDNIGKPNWNPLGFLIKPNMNVALKPNFVLSSHKEKGNLFSVITHPSVLRAVADYVSIALEGKGSITICDAPQYDCNFNELLEQTKVLSLKKYFDEKTNINFNVFDLRKYWSSGKHFESMKQRLNGDPNGSLIVDLKEKSSLNDLENIHHLYGAMYDRQETISHHINGKHEYEVSKTILDADVVISVPKLKVHKKVGVTLNLKGLVGINTNKNYLVHYRIKSPKEGGDQYPEDVLTPLERFLIKTERWMYDNLLAKKKKHLEYLHRSIYWIHNHSTKLLGIKVDPEKRLMDAGNWYGNDSAWRMTSDLSKVFLFCDKDGVFHTDKQRKSFSIIDGIIGGELNGPLTPTEKKSGIIISGENLVAVDLVGSRIMGFDYTKMKLFVNILREKYFNFGIKSIDEIEVKSNIKEYENCFKNKSKYLDFEPHIGWKNKLKIEE